MEAGMEEYVMEYRDFGNTGARISALGFGAMRLPEYEETESGTSGKRSP